MSDRYACVPRVAKAGQSVSPRERCRDYVVGELFQLYFREPPGGVKCTSPVCANHFLLFDGHRVGIAAMAQIKRAQLPSATQVSTCRQASIDR